MNFLKGFVQLFEMKIMTFGGFYVLTFDLDLKFKKSLHNLILNLILYKVLKISIKLLQWCRRCVTFTKRPTWGLDNNFIYCIPRHVCMYTCCVLSLSAHRQLQIQILNTQYHTIIQYP